MKRSFFLLFIFTILLPAFAVEGQSALKNNIPFGRDLNTRGEIPFNYSNFKNPGPVSRNVYFGPNKLGKDHVSAGLSQALNGITVYDANQKGNSLFVKLYNKRGTIKKFSKENLFLSHKRHN